MVKEVKLTGRCPRRAGRARGSRWTVGRRTCPGTWRLARAGTCRSQTGSEVKLTTKLRKELVKATRCLEFCFSLPTES